MLVEMRGKVGAMESFGGWFWRAKSEERRG
jgi:hypothetical protein